LDRIFQPSLKFVRKAKQWLGAHWKTLVRWVSLHGGPGPGWLHSEVQAQLGQASPEGPLSKWVIVSEVLRAPGRKAVLTVIGLYVVLGSVSALLAWWDPAVQGLPEELDSVYVTLWQVQAAIAAFALPLLLFFIELSRDDREAATRTPEVLLRESGALFVIAFSLLGAFRIGFDIAWFATESVFVIDLFLVLLATIGLALWAYYVVLSVILSRTQLKRKSTELLRERMRRAVRHSLEVRVGTNILLARLKRIGVQYWPLLPEPQATQYAYLTTDRRGYLVDVHLDELEAFIERLPWASPAPQRAQDQQPTLSATAVDSAPVVWILKTFGDRVTETDNALLRLERSSFGALDEGVLSQRLGPIMKIRRTDEF
jgi:hypothetical protein